MEEKSKIVLLDVHAILHRAYHAIPGFTSSKGEPTGALYGLAAFLIKIIAELKPDYLVACYDLPGPTFRKKVYDEYKAGRAKTDPELVSQIVRSRDLFKAFNIPIYEQAGFEADDIIGTICQAIGKLKIKNEKLKTIIASGDMDTLQLVSGDAVVVYTLRKGINDTVIYNEAAVRERFGFGPELIADYKGLRGDPSDNIVGIKGIGEKTATELITKFGSVENIYKELKSDPAKFIKDGIKQRIIGLLRDNEEEAAFSKMLATIKRDVPISFSLPAKSWLGGLDMAKTRGLFQELEFKSLWPRLQNVISGQAEDSLAHGYEGDSQMNPLPGSLSKSEAIAAWLLNSDLTDPTEDEILSALGAKDLAGVEKVLPKKIKEAGLDFVYYDIELPIIPIISQAEDRGILIDKKHLEKLSGEYHASLQLLEKKIREMAGAEFNVNSSKQLAEVLFDKLKLTAKGLRKTAGGARSTRESELRKMEDVHPIIAEILSYREIQKLLSTYIDPLPVLADGVGRLHTSLNQMGTTTGRLSSSNPNLQNIPAAGDMAREIRRAFVATDGFKLATFDYSQIEMRVLAWLSQDDELIRIFRGGYDIHTAVAARVFGVSEAEVSKEMRRKAKVINFGIIYGMGIGALKKNLGSTTDEAEKFYNNFFAQFPKIKIFFEKIKEEVRRNGYTVTAYGRRRYFPMIKSPLPYVRAESERMAVNAVIQGTATADIIKIAMRSVDSALKKSGLDDSAKLILQVHDELMYEVKDGAGFNGAMDIIKEAMETAVALPVPLAVNAYTGANWGDLKVYGQTG